MKKRLLQLSIIFLGGIASLIYYRFLNTDSNLPIGMNSKITKVIDTESIDDKMFIKKNVKRDIALSKVPLDKNISIEESDSKIEPLDIPYDTPETIELHTQEVYDALQPENYDESIEQANEAFEILDEHLHQVEQELKNNMQIDASSPDNREANSVEDEPYEMEIPTINE